MAEWIKEHKVYVIPGVLLAVILVFYLMMPGKSDETAQGDWEQAQPPFLEEETEMEPEDQEEGEEMLVDVKGAVRNPGVYYAKPGQRVIDMIEEAGGLMEDADESALNFAMRVVDEMVIYVPRTGEEPGSREVISLPEETEKEGKVNLNQADQSQLETLPGVGPSKAAAIIEYREKNGPFKVIEDLMLVSGFGEKTFEKLKDKITVK